MTTIQTDIKNLSSELEFEKWMKRSISHYIDIMCDMCLISIENRQPYCDRGRYIVKVFSHSQVMFSIDEQDMFPRYYFLFDNLISEMDCWMKFRKVNFISFHKHKHGEQKYDDSK
jgi:hypothetical protein